jgi:mRNA interferase RelE/StbE
VASYSVIVTKDALKELASVDSRVDRKRIWEKIHKLASNPRPHGSEKLEGSSERYRLRQGDYRVLYEIRDEVLIVAVVHVRHRKDVYRRGRA